MAVIKRIDLADLQGTIPLVDAQGLPSPGFLRFLNTTVRALKTGINNLIDVQNAVDAANAAAATANAAAAGALASAATATAATATVAHQTALVSSWIEPLSVLTATPTHITIASHMRFYADGTSVAVTGATISGTGPPDVDYVYYSDPSHAGGAVTYQVTTLDAPAQIGDVHVVGSVSIPTTGTVVGTSGPTRPGGQ